MKPIDRRCFCKHTVAAVIATSMGEGLLLGCGSEEPNSGAPAASGDGAPPDAGAAEAEAGAAEAEAAPPDGSPEPDAGGLPGFVPELLVGFGAATTGGRGGKVVRVTSLSDSVDAANSIRWALEQHAGQPLYIALCVEGEVTLATPLTIKRPNVTIDGRYAPGAGCWFATNRIQVEADNVFLDNVMHFGNDDGANDDSDCLRWGIYSTDATSAQHVVNGYARRCEFHHGRDEVFSFTPRANGQATGNTVQNVTVDRCLIANPTGATHEFLFFIGDGSEKITCVSSLLFTAAARFPLVRSYAMEIEWFNNAAYNFNDNCLAFMGDAQVSFRGNLLRLGPRWNDIRAPISLDAGDQPVYVDDTVVDSPLGKTNTHGLTRGGSPAASQGFTGSGIAVAAGSTVAASIAAIGALRHGGSIGPIAQTLLDAFQAGNAPPSLAVHPGATPTATAASYPENADGVPNDYLAVFPSDTDLEAIISEGGDWDTHMVAERVGAWLVRSP